MVRATERGPLLEIPRHTGGEPIAVSWVGTRIPDVRSIASLLAVARAADAEALREALVKHHEPTLAIVYADAAGAAGMQVAGWIPRRELPSGLVPLPGRAPWYDWKGRVPFEELPRIVLEGGAGWTIAADNPLRGTGPAEPVEWLWRTGERARRIDALLTAAVAEGPVDLLRIAALQADVAASRARALMQASLELAGSPTELDAEAREVAGLMRTWDGRADADSVGSAAYHVFLECLIEQLFRDALGPELMRRYLSLPHVDPSHAVFEIVSDSIAGASDTWTRRARVSKAVNASLREAWLRLSYRLGTNRQKWNWGRLHPLRFQPFGPGGAGLDALGPIAYGGSSATVSVAEYDSADPFRVRVASTFRFAVDAQELDEALVSIAPGQSEHPGHPHFDDGLDDWLKGRSRLLATSRLLVAETSVSRLVLEPRP